MANISFDMASECFNRYPLKKDMNMFCIEPFEMGDLKDCMVNGSMDHSECVYYARSTGGVIQAFQCAHTPKGGAALEAHEYTLCKMKVDLEWTCEQIQQFYGTCLQSKWYDNTSMPLDWRFPRWMIENMILPQWAEDMSLIRWNGVRVEPTPGVAGDVLESCNGVAWQTQRAIDEGKLTPIVLGTLEKDTIREQIKCFMMSIPKKYRRRPWKLLGSCEAVQCLREANNNRVAGSCCANDAGSFSAYIPEYNVTLEGIQELEGTNALIWTPAGNMFEKNMTGEAMTPNLCFDVDKKGRSISASLEFHRAFGVNCWNEFFISDSFTNPSALPLKVNSIYSNGGATENVVKDGRIKAA